MFFAIPKVFGSLGKGTQFSEAHIGTKVSDSYGSNGQGLDMRTPTEVTLPLEQGQVSTAMVFLAKGVQQVIPDAQSLPAFR